MESTAHIHNGGDKDKALCNTCAANTVATQVLLIGDVHGNLEQLTGLWRVLEEALGAQKFADTHVVFLGDFCDRGPHTKEVLNFLVALQKSRPRTLFIAGNHDFAMSAFLGLLPEPHDGAFRQTWENHQLAEYEKIWTDANTATSHHNNMHLQGRRWAAQADIFNASATFSSYGVAFGDREGLCAAVPHSHKEFLASLPWVVTLPCAWGTSVMCVHAGLDFHAPLAGQLRVLESRDNSIPRPEQLFGRTSVMHLHPSLAASGVVLASGHHGILDRDKSRPIVDEGGGKPHKALCALLLPSREVFRSPLPAKHN